MPTFKLDPPKFKPTYNLQRRILYTKNIYSPQVKVQDWETKLLSYPWDTDPYCPGKVNHFLSHHNTFGFQPNSPLQTETQEMLEQAHITEKPIDGAILKKPFVNYFSYRDTNKCGENTGICPEVCTDYKTTMQESYPSPFPYAVNRISLPNVPHLQNRVIRDEYPQLSHNKFYDDDFSNRTCMLAKNKSFRWTSFNPWLGVDSDGSDKPTTRAVCYKLDF